ELGIDELIRSAGFGSPTCRSCHPTSGKRTPRTLLPHQSFRVSILEQGTRRLSRCPLRDKGIPQSGYALAGGLVERTAILLLRRPAPGIAGPLPSTYRRHSIRRTEQPQLRELQQFSPSESIPQR